MSERDLGRPLFDSGYRRDEWRQLLTGSKFEAVSLYLEMGYLPELDNQVVRISQDNFRQLKDNSQINELLSKAKDMSVQLSQSLRSRGRYPNQNDKYQLFCRRFKFDFPSFDELSDLSIPDLLLLLHRFNVLADPKLTMTYNMVYAESGKETSSSTSYIGDLEVQEALRVVMKKQFLQVRPQWEQSYFSDELNYDAYLALVQTLINSMVNVDEGEEGRSITLEEVIEYASAHNLPFSTMAVAQTLSRLIQHETFQQLSQENDLKLSEHRFVIGAISQLYLDVALHDIRTRSKAIESATLPFTSPIVHRGKTINDPNYAYGTQLTKIPVTSHYLLTLPKVIDHYVISIPDNLQPGVLFDRRLIYYLLKEAQKLVLDQLELLGYKQNSALAAVAMKTFGKDVLNNTRIADQFESAKKLAPQALTPWQVMIVRVNRFINTFADRGWVKSSQDMDRSVAEILDRYNKQRRQFRFAAPDWTDRATSINHFGGKQNRTKKIRFEALARRGNV